MTVSSKVRIYDLAKELKLDTKRLIEEVRREGVDVSVPSNSVSKELADKIRNKYFPKKEKSAPRAVRVVKRAKPAEPTAEEAETASEVAAVAADVAAPVEAPVEVEPARDTSAPKPTAARLVKKLTPAVRAEQPGATPAQGSDAAATGTGAKTAEIPESDGSAAGPAGESSTNRRTHCLDNS
jgi:translation initiation factor IF-2